MFLVRFVLFCFVFLGSQNLTTLDFWSTPYLDFLTGTAPRSWLRHCHSESLQNCPQSWFALSMGVQFWERSLQAFLFSVIMRESLAIRLGALSREGHQRLFDWPFPDSYGFVSLHAYNCIPSGWVSRLHIFTLQLQIMSFTFQMA